MQSSIDAHFVACRKLLNTFAASGHLHYVNSGRLFVQMMRSLKEEHHWIYKMYMDDGRHTVQRTDHPMNGLLTDLIIEHVLGRSLKTRGELTQCIEE